MTIFEEIRAKLSQLKTNDYGRYLNVIEEKNNLKKMPLLKIVCLRSFTVEPLEPFLKLRLILEGFNPEFFYGNYNQFAQEVFNDSSFLYEIKPDIILFFSRLEDLLPDFNLNFNSKSSSQWKKALELSAKQFGAYAKHLRKQLDSQLVFQNMSFISFPYWGVYDAQQNQNQAHLVHEFNQILAKEMSSVSNAFIWDYNHFLLRKGHDCVYDPKMWYLAKNPFKYSAYPEIVSDLCRYIISALGKVKKCIILDLDNTLWGGIVGEDGFSGIILGEDYPGSCFRELQMELLKLYHRGILLAINSKNNENDAFEVIDKHPGMILKRNHFAAYRINWKDKATNLLELAEELNIGIDSMIFIDDNSRECELVRQKFPECTVIELPKAVYKFPKIIHSLYGIENIRLTEEDKKKGKMYQAQISRRDIKKTVDNLEDFLKSLDIEVAFNEANDISISRIAQLTQKTNQMNLTTRRYSESDIRSILAKDDSFVYSVSARDKLGDHGIIAVIILKIRAEECYIDTLLLSCRVIGLTIEQSMLAFIHEKAGERGCKRLIGEYIPTKKNKPAADIYEKAKFRKTKDSFYVLNLIGNNIQYSPFIRQKIN